MFYKVCQKAFLHSFYEFVKIFIQSVRRIFVYNVVDHLVCPHEFFRFDHRLKRGLSEAKFSCEGKVEKDGRTELWWELPINILCWISIDSLLKYSSSECPMIIAFFVFSTVRGNQSPSFLSLRSCPSRSHLWIVVAWSNRGEKPAIDQFLQGSLPWLTNDRDTNVRKWRQFVLVCRDQKSVNKIMPGFEQNQGTNLKLKIASRLEAKRS